MPISSPQPLVLVADPDVEFTAHTGSLLEWAGYEVMTTGDADVVLDLVEKRRPDALVIEAVMRGATGYDVVRELRAKPYNAGMAIFMIGSRAGKLDHDFALTVGADDYVRKPVSYSEIVARLALHAPAGARREVPTVARRGLRLSRPALQPALAR
jgi:DNA-binding response OmpR family regulator